MKTRHLILAGLASIVFAACSENDYQELVTKKRSGLKVEVTDEFTVSATRADYSGFPSTTFEEGDAIGVYAFDGSTYVASNVRFEKQADGSWASDSYVPYVEDYTYYAYFPYRSTVYTPSTSGTADAVDTKFASFVSDDSNYFWKADQSTEADFTYSNLMISKGTVTNEEESIIKFTMQHKRGLAVINGVGNKWHYTDAVGIEYTPTVISVTSDNVPYSMGDKQYYLTKPGIATDVAGKSVTINAGEYKYSKITLTRTPTYTYYLNGSGSSSSKPAWLTVTETVVEGEPTEFAVTTTPASSTDCISYSDGENTTEVNILKTNAVAVNADLSMMNNDGTPTASRTTANCYLVHAPGSYKIPLVYGNAIKNGEDNTLAYYPGRDGSITNGRSRFVNHTDTGITGPWITKSGSGVDAGMGLTVASAELLWQDVRGLISTVGVDGDYLTFTVNADNIAPGNAIIAVKDGSGDIVWSWHIWVTTETLSPTTTISTPNHNYTVSPVNLGWVSTTKRTYIGNTCRVQASSNGVTMIFDVTQASETMPLGGINTYYQWGRKDPFIPAAAYNSSSDHTVYDISGSTTTGYTYQVSTTATIGDNIKNPTITYRVEKYFGPVNSGYMMNVWDARNAAKNNVSSATKKTIYDPCPPGFCVPTSNLFYFMGDSNSRPMTTWDETNKGALWNININGDVLWFPATGARESSSILNYVGTRGYYWSATPMDSGHGRGLSLTTSWNTNYGDRSTPRSVRPVAEE